MNDLRKWEEQQPHRAVCPEPGPLDSFLVVLINGRRVAFYGIEQHSHLRMVCMTLAMREKCQVKVLPVTGDELLALYGIQPAAPQPIANMDAAFREQAIKNCHAALVECDDARVRQDALDMLGALGGLGVMQ
jgi:hypothetical protein